VNNLSAYAFTTGQVLIKSDGSPWRPLVHIEDISRAFLAVLEAPRDLVHNVAFNVGHTDENYRVREVAAIVEEIFAGSQVTYAEGASADIRNYRVDCDKILETLPAYRPQWTVRKSVQELHDAFVRYGLELEDFLSRRFMRIKHVRELQAEGALDQRLRRLALGATHA
jgi:nucleoside-diphosphate-sugar epimerase